MQTGKVAAALIASALLALAPAVAAETMTKATGADILKKLNTDGDDTLEMTEVIALAQKTFGAINPDGDSTLEPDEVKGRVTEEEWKSVNKDGDETLEMDEWLTIARARFAQADANKDGKLTAAELDSKAGRGVVLMIVK